MNRTTSSNNLRYHNSDSFLRRFGAGAGTVVAALMLAGLGALGSVSPGYAQIGGATYTGEISAGDVCGGGTIAITLSGDAEFVTTVYIDGAQFGAVPIDDLELPDLDISVQDDGSFATATDLLSFEGLIDGNTLSGSITVPIFGCTVTFAATTSATAPESDEPAPEPEEPADEDTDVSAQDSSSPGAVDSMPTAGAGPYSRSGNGAFWLLLAAVLGSLGLATTAAALLRRRA